MAYGSARSSSILFGLYDMLGNVAQWVQDCRHFNYDGAPTDGSEWTGGDCYARVNRGGAWDEPPQYIRVAHRLGMIPGFRHYNLGIRVGRTLTP
jgi:formylglycine-generating enzyme required for sulfatase activity